MDSVIDLESRCFLSELFPKSGCCRSKSKMYLVKEHVEQMNWSYCYRKNTYYVFI